MERRIYSEELKHRIVKQIESGELSIAEARRMVGAPKGVIQYWLSEYGRFKPQRNIVEVIMKDDKERLQELEKALADAHLKIKIYEELVELAKKEYKIDLKKSFGTEVSESSKPKGKKLK